MASRLPSNEANKHPTIESTVTRLLVAIKDLLEVLNQWAVSKATEDQVSDVYVRLGNGLNDAVGAFAEYRIDMSELMSIPDELRLVLEQCLSEEASQENLEIYLPNVRQTITTLLQGLRSKQAVYRSLVEHRQKSSRQGSSSSSSSVGGEREGRPRSSRREGERGHRSQLSRTISENETPTSRSSDKAGDRPTERESISRRGAVSGSIGRKKEASLPTPTPIQKDEEPSAPRDSKSVTSKAERSSQSRRRAHSPASSSRTVSETQSILRSLSEDGPSRTTLTDPTSPPPQPLPQVPASVTRYSLVDGPVHSPYPPTPTVVINEPSTSGSNHDVTVNGNAAAGSSSPDTPPMEVLPAPAMDSLAALKKSDFLERRASKRFSTYNISKMTGTSVTRDRPVRSNSNRRSLAAANAPLTVGELAVLAEEGEEQAEQLEEGKESGQSRSGSAGPTSTTPPVPPLPPSVTSSLSPSPEPTVVPPVVNGVVGKQPPAVPEKASDKLLNGSSETFPVFLQVGREVKKVRLESGLSFSSLRVLFVDKFSYNPGLESFPAVYIRDPSSGVQYELENMDEVKENCLLSLNIEPLDQIKQHIDTQMLALSRDIKDLRTALANRQSWSAPTPIANPAESPLVRPTDKHFQTVAKRISRLVGDNMTPTQTQPSRPLVAQATGQSLQPQLTGGSVMSEYSTRVVADLKTQFDEVQNLRRDLGVMRQLYTEFTKSTKESLGTLRTQTQSVKQLANTSIGGARAYIDSGKKQLDVRSQNVLTKVEELQDKVESMKDDVLKRQVTPKPQLVKRLKEDIARTAAELESLKEHLKTVQPMWKKTWAEELQNVVEEQQFLKHQEDFLNDLLEDQAAMVEVFGHVEKVISIRGTGSGRAALRAKGFKPAPPEEAQSGISNVMFEIRGAAVNSGKRMEAIAANQKSREKELETRGNELQVELNDFVAGKKLKLTGGAEEAERVRQRRNELTMKAMFSGGVPG